MLPKGAHFWYKGDDGLWWLGKISARTTENGIYLVRCLDDPGPIKLALPPARYTTSTGAVQGLGASRSTKPERSPGESNVTQMNLEARLWLVDLHAAAALDSFPFFWVFLLWLFLPFSAS